MITNTREAADKNSFDPVTMLTPFNNHENPFRHVLMLILNPTFGFSIALLQSFFVLGNAVYFLCDRALFLDKTASQDIIA